MSLQIKKNIRFIGISFLLSFSMLLSKAATDYGGMDSSVIVKAMKDELNRNLKQLDYKDYGRPFYIGYTITDANMYYINASLGALVTSENLPNRDWQVRVLVGNYQLNDENFQDISASSGKPAALFEHSSG